MNYPANNLARSALGFSVFSYLITPPTHQALGIRHNFLFLLNLYIVCCFSSSLPVSTSARIPVLPKFIFVLFSFSRLRWKSYRIQTNHDNSLADVSIIMITPFSTLYIVSGTDKAPFITRFSHRPLHLAATLL